MDWTIQDLGAIGEFVGSLAVLITLIYLSFQVRQSTRIISQNATALLGATEISSNEQNLKFMLTSAQDIHLAEVLVKGFAADELTRLERARFNNYLQAAFQSHQIYFMQWQRQQAGDEVWNFFARYFGDQMLKAPGVVAWWERHAEIFIPEFRHYLDTAIAALVETSSSHRNTS